MPISVGQRFVRRQNAARTSTANATAADVTYDTAVLSEGDYSYSSPEVTVDTAGYYLNVFDLGQCDLASTRAVGTLIPRVNTTDQPRFRATHRYLRNSGGSQEAASIGMAILDLSVSDDVSVRNPGVLTPTDAIGNYATNASFGGALQLIRLPDGNLTHVERTVDAAEVGTSNINATRPWLDSSGTWTTITYNSEVQDDDSLYPGTGGDVTLAASTKYMVVWGATIYSTDASRHTNVVRLQIDGNNVQSGSGYQRNTASQGTPICGMYLHETGGSTETLRLQATHETEGGDAGTPQVSDAYLQIIELPSSAEWIHVDNGTTDSMTTALAGLTTWYDTPLSSTLRADGDSNLSLDGANNAVQNDSGGSLPVLAIGWHRWDRDSGASGIRKNPWSRWDNGGTSVGYGVAGAYSRGQQSTDDTFQAHYCSVATMDLADGADLSFQAQDEASASNADMGIYASTSRYFLGVQVLNLNSLEAAGSGAIDVAPEIAFGQTINLTGIGVLDAAPSIDFGVTASLTGVTVKGDWGTVDLGPWVLPIQEFTNVVSNSISVNTSIDFGETIALTGVGSLQVSPSVDWAVTSTLTGVGALQASASIDWGVTATLGGVGSISSSTGIAFSETLNLTGIGALSLAESIDWSVTAGLTGIGSLSVAESVDWSVTADLTGFGALSVTPSIGFSVTADLGAATDNGIDVNTSIAFAQTANLTGIGSIDVAPSVDFGVSASLTGRGALVSAQSIDFSQSATLSGAVSLQLATSIDFAQAAVMTAVGSLTASPSIGFGQSTTLTGVGQLQFADSIDWSVTADLTGIGSLQAATSVDFAQTAALTASGAKGDWGTVDLGPWVLPIQPIPQATTLQLSTSMALFNGFFFLTEAADDAIQVATDIAFGTTANLTGRGALDVSTSIDWGVTASLSGGATLDVATSVDWSLSATLTGVGALQSSESVDWSITSTITGIGALTQSTSVDFGVTATLSDAESSSLAVAPNIAFSTNATLTGIASLDVSTSVDFGTSFTFTGTSRLSASTSITVDAAAQITLRGRLIASTNVDWAVSADISLPGGLSVAPSINWTMTPTLTGIGSLSFATSVDFDLSTRISGPASSAFIFADRRIRRLERPVLDRSIERESVNRVLERGYVREKFVYRLSGPTRTVK